MPGRASSNAVSPNGYGAALQQPKTSTHGATMSSAGLEFLPQVLFTLNAVSRFRNERFRELENRFQNCRGLAAAVLTL